MVAPLIWLFVLAIPVACIAWTVTHEELFREPRDWCRLKSEHSRRFAVRKLFYMLTCEYCFSHYVAAVMLALAPFRLLQPGWRGLVIAWLSLVWIANVYMSAFGRLRLDIKQERTEIELEERRLKAIAKRR